MGHSIESRAADWGVDHPSTRRIFLQAVGASAATWSMWPDSSSGAAEPPIIKELDLREVVNSDVYFVVFSARTQSLLPERLGGQPFSLGGHAYAGWGREDSSSNMSYAQVYGLYPKEESLGKWTLIIGPILGVVREGLEHDVQVRLICKVSKDAYDRAAIVRSDYQSIPPYQTLYNDCTTFVSDVAKAVGLNTPDRMEYLNMFPAPFVRRLATLNEQKNFYDGIWESTDTGTRWRLEVRNKQCVWTERSKSGTSLVRTVPVVQKDGFVTISRENDASALRFLGARDNLVGPLLARAPQPSYMELRRQDADTIAGHWTGFRWTLDAQNRLASVQQPGVMFTDYSFKRPAA